VLLRLPLHAGNYSRHRHQRVGSVTSTVRYQRGGIVHHFESCELLVPLNPPQVRPVPLLRGRQRCLRSPLISGNKFHREAVGVLRSPANFSCSLPLPNVSYDGSQDYATVTDTCGTLTNTYATLSSQLGKTTCRPPSLPTCGQLSSLAVRPLQLFVASALRHSPISVCSSLPTNNQHRHPRAQPPPLITFLLHPDSHNDQDSYYVKVTTLTASLIATCITGVGNAFCCNHWTHRHPVRRVAAPATYQSRRFSLP